MPSIQSSIDIFRLIRECLERHLPLAAYRLPGEKQVHLILQDSPKLEVVTPETRIIDEKGFAFYPFVNSAMPRVVIRADFHLTDDGKWTDKTMIDILRKIGFSDNGFYREEPYQQSKRGYCDGVELMKREIKIGNITKGVLSRVHVRKVKTPFDPVDFFRTMLDLYPSAMAYMTYLPHIGLWLGATPEMLLQTSGDELHTVSLAGTKRSENSESVKWGVKELLEQKIVTDHIKNCLDKYFDDFILEGPQTVHAGPVRHLKTIFKARSKKSHITQVFDDLLGDLHPTPAVVGMPRDAALRIIAETEKHDRAYYTGFLGPVNINGKTELFVNLRCMETLHEGLAIYAGAGITADSNPESEWDETNLKVKTLLDAL